MITLESFNTESQKVISEKGLTPVWCIDGGMGSHVSLLFVDYDSRKWTAKGVYPAWKKIKLVESTLKAA